MLEWKLEWSNMKNIAIVTGASSGLGKEFVKQIDARFASMDEIWVIARRKERITDYEAYIATPLKILDYDLCDNSSMDKLKNLLETENVKIKMLVNCAGFGLIGKVEELDAYDQGSMVELNVKALTVLTRICLPYMTYAGRIINVASSAAFLPQPGFAVYAATKSYVLSFSRALARELKKECIYVTAVCPGPVNTEFFDIAEKQSKMAWYKKYTIVEAPEVVKKAIDDSMARKTVSVYGRVMRAFRVMAKFIPHEIMLKFL